MFELFRGKKNQFIGIDFGTSSIKVVKLSYHEQRAHLENYGVVDLDFSNKERNQQPDLKSQSYDQMMNAALKKLLASMEIEEGYAYVSIPGFNGLITIIELPEMRSDELDKAIQFEAHKYIPTSLDEVAMSWEVIGHTSSSGGVLSSISQTASLDAQKKISVLLVAAPKKDIDRYDKFVSGTNLTVNAIELETFSITRALAGDEAGNYLIIDIGSRATNMILVEKGVVKVNRNIDAGGNEITSALADIMNVSHQRAEMFKVGEKDLINDKESGIIVPVLELITGESMRILKAYAEKNSGALVDGIILSGGTSKMKGLSEYFSRTLGGKVTIGNPWRRVSMQPEIEPIIARIGASFSVAVGLAFRGIEDYKRK